MRPTIKALQSSINEKRQLVEFQLIELNEARKQKAISTDEITRLSREVNWLKDLVRTLSTKIRDA